MIKWYDSYQKMKKGSIANCSFMLFSYGATWDPFPDSTFDACLAKQRSRICCCCDHCWHYPCLRRKWWWTGASPCCFCWEVTWLVLLISGNSGKDWKVINIIFLWVIFGWFKLTSKTLSISRHPLSRYSRPQLCHLAVLASKRQCLLSSERFDPTLNTWTPLPDMNERSHDIHL